MIFLDNSASTFVKPKEVIKAVNYSLEKLTANPGRSGHKASTRAALEVQQVREKIARHFNAPGSECVVFTANCSEALNIAILGLARPGGHVVCTENEHNSVLRPLFFLSKERGVEFSVARQSRSGGICLDDIKKQIRPNTYMVICNHISNVNGDIADIESIGAFCKQRGLIFVVDCAQSGGHKRIDMQKCGIDILAIAGHKGFYAPQAIGAMVLAGSVMPSPIKFGGTGTNSLDPNMPKESPDRFETGTLSTPSIVGLGAGIDFVENNFDEICAHLDDLTTYVNYELSKLPIDVYTSPENAYGVLAFNVPGVHSNDIANYLDERWGICVRGGFHCAPEKHKALGTLQQGAVRVSFSYFNNFSDAARLCDAVKHYLKSNKIL